MTAPTVAVEWLLARAAVRATGLLHVVSRRDSGALNPVCGANPIRSEKIETHTYLTDVALLCDGCAAMATSFGGTVYDGVALLLGLSDSLSSNTTVFTTLALNTITRTETARNADEELIASVAESGVIVPVIVGHATGTSIPVNGYGIATRGLFIIDGNRRVAAALAAGMTDIPAVVRRVEPDDLVMQPLLANLHRADLNPIEQANAYQHALDALTISKAELGRRLGISREQISNTIRLLALPLEDQERIAAGEMTAQAGRAALAKPTPSRDADPALAGIADLLTGLLDAKVRVTRTGDRAKITLDVPEVDLARLLETLGVAA